jgi:murein L,D-transpeptidase YcbB/YkuD
MMMIAGALALPGPIAMAAAAAPAKKTPVRAAAAQKSAARATAPSVSDAVIAALRAQAGGKLKRVYAERAFQPLWVSGSRIGPQGEALVGYLASADLDGLKPARYRAEAVRQAIREANAGDAQAVARTELLLSDMFARYVMDLRRPENIGMIYADPALKPRKLRAENILRAAGFPKPFGDYVADMGWMSPHYVRLRTLARRARAQGVGADQMARLQRNLDRARMLPGPWTRHVVVDASSGRLWYYEAGKEAGTMRVVVGAQATQTPMLAGMLQWAILNPYWNVPTYLARNSVAPKVLAGRSLTSLKMEALSDWGPAPRKLAASEIDWAAVAAGTQELRLRELPGAKNSMGKVKFLFPNGEGIYLHDTPDRALLSKPDRHFSNGCIRLESAETLGRWLLHKPLKNAAVGSKPEQAVPLPVQVPVYLTYLTATATDSGLAFRNDIYRRDE